MAQFNNTTLKEENYQELYIYSNGKTELTTPSLETALYRNVGNSITIETMDLKTKTVQKRHMFLNYRTMMKEKLASFKNIKSIKI